MGITSNIALAEMAHYWICKGKLSNATKCLEELLTELEKGELKNEKTILKTETIENTNTKTKNNNSTYTWR